MPLREMLPEQVFPHSQNDKKAFEVLIIDRDTMGSGLLADALMRNLDCHASGSRPSNALEVVAKGNVDVLIISADLSAKPGAGFELAHAVSTANPSLPIVILLDDSSRDPVVNAFRSGARGVFNRQEPVRQFLECVTHVRNGAIWATGGETTFLLDALKSIPAPSDFTEGTLSTLTTRELQVVRYAAQGKTNKVIANELCLSEHTVKNYLFRAFEKLGVSSRVELLFLLTMRGHSFSSTPEVETVGAPE